jgi:hypothetical protein
LNGTLVQPAAANLYYRFVDQDYYRSLESLLPILVKMQLKILLSYIILCANAYAQQGNASSAASCHCLPNDPCWPSDDIWDNFNSSLGGKLIQNVPIALPCHNPGSASYNISACEHLQKTWYFPETHINHPSSVMAPYFNNNSCNPFSNASDSCMMGNYAEYSVNATDISHYRMTIQFAKIYNIRMVIRNTAHDYNGKSTGAGSLALWVQHLKWKELLYYNSTSYSGNAFKFGAGVLVQEAYEFADFHNLTVVGANQGTVGLVGGYTQGGGHGPLASRLGLAADQVLEWEVILENGQTVTASASSPAHPDLYWALCGGGGGTFGAVTSVTVKAHPGISLSTASLSFALPSNASDNDTKHFFEAITTFTKQIPKINDAGGVAIWFITSQAFTLSSLYGPGLKPEDLDWLLQPVLSKLQEIGFANAYRSEQHGSFLAGFQKQPSVQISNLNIAGRLIPRRLVDDNAEALTSAIRNITAQGALFSGVSFNVSMHASSSVGANPQLRESAFDAVIATPFDWAKWQTSADGQDILTYSLLPLLERLTPGGGAYLNEADFQQPDWEQTFYGQHYERLLGIKKRYDPTGTFYALGAVGSDLWVGGSGSRICRAS